MKINIFKKQKIYFLLKIKEFYYFILLFFIITIPLKVFSGTATKIGNPIKAQSINQLIQTIIKIVIAIGTPIAVLFLIYSGFKFVMARGNSEKLIDAKKTFIWVLIGIVILLGAGVLSEIIKGTVNQLKVGI